MFSLFEFAVGVRLLMFVVFVACVYGGECPVCASGTPQNKISLETCFCDALFNFSPPGHLCCLARFLLWFKCLKSIIPLDIQKIHLVLIDGMDFSIFRCYLYCYDDDF